MGVLFSADQNGWIRWSKYYTYRYQPSRQDWWIRDIYDMEIADTNYLMIMGQRGSRLD